MAVRQRKNVTIREYRNIVLQQNNVKHVIKQSQQYMRQLSDNLGNYLPFDNTVEPHDCIDRLVSHRITSKFHIDDPRVAGDLQSQCFLNYVSYDNALSTSVDWRSSFHLRKARAFLYREFRDFEVDFSDTEDYSVTPGETYISSRGEVSILAKLFDRSHWTVTANCLDDACVFIYHNLAFKRAARQHIGVLTRKERRKLYQRFKHLPDIGFHVFKHLLISRVLILTDGARASSVPKSNDKRRFINIEAMFSVILQRITAAMLLLHMERFGNYLGVTNVKLEQDPTGMLRVDVSAQALHGLLIKSPHFATIDFTNASDSVTLAAIRSMFPQHVSDLFLRLRSHFVVIDGHYHEPHKLSSMGNGFTFEVMTIILFAIAQSFSKECRVYGDDVILPNEVAHQFVSTCKLIDFRVNEKKTFINSFFRESCGYFYSDHISDYITSFDFNQIKNLSDCIITCNKLSVIIDSGQVSHELYYKLEHTRDQIAALIHASRKGPLPVGISQQRKYLALYVFDDGYRKKQSRNTPLRELRKHYIKKNEWYFSSSQVSSSDYSLLYLPFFVPEKSAHVFSNMDGLEVLLPALYSNKRLKATIKGKGKWVDLPAFVHLDGTITLISNLRSMHTGVWHDRLLGVVAKHEKM